MNSIDLCFRLNLATIFSYGDRFGPCLENIIKVVYIIYRKCLCVVFFLRNGQYI